MMQATVGHQKDVATRDLAVDDAADIDAGFADEVTPQLEHDLRLWQAVGNARKPARQAGSDRGDVERLLAGEVRNAKPSADIEQAHGRGSIDAESYRQLERLFLRFLDRAGAQVLRAAEDVKTLKVELQLSDPREHFGHALGVHPELLGTAAHLHARAFELEIRVDPYRNARALAGGFGEPGEAFHFAFRFEINHDAGGYRLRKLCIGLAGTCKTDFGRAHARGERDVELAAGGDIEPVDEAGKMLYDREHRVGFDRIVQLNTCRQMPAQQLDACRDEAA